MSPTFTTVSNRAKCIDTTHWYKLLDHASIAFTRPSAPAATIFGINVEAGSGERGIAQRVSWLGGNPWARLFYSNGLGSWNSLGGGPSSNSGEVAMAPSKRATVSFKPLNAGFTYASIASGAMDSVVTAYCNAVPSDWLIDLTMHHEPNLELSQGQFTITDYKAAWVHLSQLLWSLPSKNYVVPSVLYSAPMAKGSPVWSDTWMMNFSDLGNPNARWVWDAYGGKSGTATGTYPAPNLSLDMGYDLLASHGWLFEFGHWGIGEFNCSRRSQDTDGTNQAAWIQGYVDNLNGRVVPPHHVTLFDGSGVPDFDTVKPRKKWADIQGTGGTGV